MHTDEVGKILQRPVFKRVTTTILVEDLKYARDNGFQLSDLLRERIAQLRVQVANSEALIASEAKVQSWRNKCEEARQFLEKKGLINEFLGL